MTISYNAHHAAPGAYGTFTLGHFRTRGGFGVNDGRAPGNQQVFAGYTRDGATLECLPFFEPEQSSATAAFLGEHAGAANKSGRTFSENSITRKFGWASDTWSVPGFSLRIDSPFGPIPNPIDASKESLRQALLPAITATLEWDNTDGDTEMTGFFALQFDKAGVNLLPSESGVTGLEFAGQIAIAAPSLPDVRVIVAPDLHEALAARVPHTLFNTAGLAVRVPAGEKRTVPVTLGWYVQGPITGRLEGSYYYTRCFSSLRDVTEYALAHAASRSVWADELDASLNAAQLSPSQRFLVAHATRSYYGSSQLLDIAGEPFWIVNEGEYCMMNTFDLSVDQLFFEMRMNPWVVQNLLDSFVRHYSYVDEIRDPQTGSLFPGGISFTHDMGVSNRFSPRGYSSYEMPDKPGCFSYMTQEQLCNWILCAATYGKGNLAWLQENEYVVRACLLSMQRRDHPDPGQRNGIMGFDSSRCASGQEITTYDSLDTSLGQARNNLYVAVKCWATYIGLARIFRQLGDSETADHSEACAAKTAQTVCSKFDPSLGFIPAVFEDGNQSAIIPAIECIVFPMEWGDADAVSPSGRFSEFIQTLDRHLRAVLCPGICLCNDGGWKLSSTSRNTWMSKIAICQHIARDVFHIDHPIADEAHEKWQKEGSGYWAFCDQIIDGKAIGSKYYPRGVTCILWLKSSPWTGQVH